MKFHKILLTTFFAIGLFLVFGLFGNIQAATFTVDSTGDAADAGIDGLCATAGAVCTLRAAIAEANAAAGPHTVGFNIPTSDTGYRDFDAENTPSSGDSTGGDDYWTIRPTTSFPTISQSGVTVDGITQTTNQGNTNTSGPEVEIKNGAAITTGLQFSSAVTSGIVRGFVFNAFTENLRVSGDNVTITNSYFGCNVKCNLNIAGTASGIVTDTTADFITIGGTTSERNLFSGSGGTTSINAQCGTGGSGQHWTIAGNYFGLDPTGLAASSTDNGVYVSLNNECIALIGGDTAASRNVMTGVNTSNNGIGISLNLSNNAIPDVQIYNNFIGPAADGSLLNWISRGIIIDNTGGAYDGTQNPIKIGAPGKGNLIRHSFYANIWMVDARDIEIRNNTITDFSSAACCDDGVELGGGAGLTYIAVIENNFMCEGEIDPNFGVLTGTGTGTQGAGQLEILINGGEARNNIFCSDRGIYVMRFIASTGVIEGNIFRNSNSAAMPALSIHNITNPSVKNNTIYNHAGRAIRIVNNMNGFVENNTIYDTVKSSIWMDGTTNNNMTLRNNILYDNATDGITTDISFNNSTAGAYDIMPLDAGDLDSGNNDLMNWPEILSFEYLGLGDYIVKGRLDGNISEAPFNIEVCESDGNNSGHGGCTNTLTHLTTASIPDETTGGGNTYFNWQYEINFAGSIGTEGRTFTGIATHSQGSSSQFGNNMTANYLMYPVPLVDPVGGESIAGTMPLLDWDPSQHSIYGLNPEVDHYKVYVDGTLVASVDDSVTQYQLTSVLSQGTHTWKVVAYRTGNIVTGESVEETFVVTVAPVSYIFSLLDPIDNELITDTTPLLDWEDVDSTSGIDFYDLYIDGVFVKNTGIESSYQLLDDETLSLGNHSWYVVAYHYVGGVAEEITRALTETFVIAAEPAVEEPPPVVPPVTVRPPATKPPIDVNPPLPNFYRFDDFDGGPALLFGGITLTGLLASLLLVLLTAAKEFFERLGFLLGGIVPRKKKYWGIVFDAHKSQGLPFAVVRVYDMNEKLISTTVTDLDGRYGVALDTSGKYLVESRAKGFMIFTKEVDINDLDSPEIILDIPMVRIGEHLNILKQLWFYSLPELIKGLRALILIAMITGFVYSLYVLVLYPVLINIIIVLIYIALIIINLWMDKKSQQNVEGRVVDTQNHRGLPTATIILFTSKGEQQDVRLTNSKGVAKLRAEPGNYKVQVHKVGYAMTELEPGKKSLELEVDKRGYLSRAIFMRQS